MRTVYSLLMTLAAAANCAAQYPGQPYTGTTVPWSWPGTDAASFTVDRGSGSRPTGETVSVARLRHKIPGKARAAFWRGMKFDQAGAAKKSAAEFQSAVDIDPDFSEARGNLGVELTTLGLYDQAADEFRRALALDPATGAHHANLAYVLIQLKRNEEAEREAQAAVDLNPTDVKSQYLLGFLLAQHAKSRDRAVAYLERASREMPDAHIMLAQMYLSEGLDQLARAELDRYRQSMTSQSAQPADAKGAGAAK